MVASMAWGRPTPDLALCQRSRPIEDLTTEWTAAKRLQPAAGNRIPLHNWDSSGWIRTIDLTIMSRAL